jgi:hypothetical protein
VILHKVSDVIPHTDNRRLAQYTLRVSTVLTHVHCSAAQLLSKHQIATTQLIATSSTQSSTHIPQCSTNDVLHEMNSTCAWRHFFLPMTTRSRVPVGAHKCNDTCWCALLGFLISLAQSPLTLAVSISAPVGATTVLLLLLLLLLLLVLLLLGS